MEKEYFTQIIKNNFVEENQKDIHQPLIEPQIISNQKEKLWSYLSYELHHAKSFVWTIAFITADMLTPLKLIMKDEDIHGEIITGTYLNFNNPGVFKELQKIPNLKVRISDAVGFHPKGYLFKYDDYDSVYIGSSNFTRNALLSNTEWNIRLTSLKNGRFVTQIQTEIAEIRQHSIPLTNAFIQKYEQNYQSQTKLITKPNKLHEQIHPNQIQQDAVKELIKMYQRGKNKALVVSATGTGKTYLSAFWTKKFNPKRFLFIVHREEILKKSIKSYQKVLNADANEFGILSGNHHDINKKYLFATVQSLSQSSNIQKFDVNAFDLIIIDEAHRSAAPSYQTILNYFQPKFWLGMTATPERPDDLDVFKNFDYNIAFEVRLQDALKENMLCPFHYVGISDYEVNGETITDLTDLKDLTSAERVKYILDQIEYYGDTSNPVHGLIFCSRTQEASELAKIFTEKGHPAIALTNQSSSSQRNQAISALEAGEIEYIITVDLFNEGIDIPCINEIVMLRNTQSSIVFTQQLGRGLRKFPKKNFVTVIDFIGNYQNNFLIPIALSGKSLDQKDEIKTQLLNKHLIGVSTINFSKISQERILLSLRKVQLNSLSRLKNEYQLLKQKVGRVPLLVDWEKYSNFSAEIFTNDHRFKNYGIFLQKMGEKISLTTEQSKILMFITQELSNGKRIHELLILQYLMAHQSINYEKIKKLISDQNAYFTDDLITSVKSILSLSFFDVKAGKQTRKQIYGNHSLIQSNSSGLSLSDWFANLLTIKNDFKRLLKDAINVGLLLNTKYNNQYKFTIGQKYNRKDVCRLLNWPKDVSAPMYGYRVTDTVCPIFITLNKDDDTKRNARYQNTIETPSIITWYTRSPRHLNSPEVKKLLNGVDIGKPQVKILVFIKDNDAEGKDYTFSGTGKIIPSSVKEISLVNPRSQKKKSTVQMQIEIQNNYKKF